jgi:asparagine synthase (glutamine-hydrolysing)
MCGINGFNFLDRRALVAMNKSLEHRGPDAEADFTDLKNKISLGHRRLAIIDLSEKGKQPMVYSHNKRKAIITFNGEIYNFQDIRNELVSKGYKFESMSDTEVMLASYLEWGEDCVKKFNGMWAFCIYDPQKSLLLLSRDRVGKKPLYYYFDGNKFIFSSEIKGILQHNLKLELNKDAIDLYFSLGFIPAPYTIYKKIEKLEQRQILVFDLNNKTIEKKYYYDWPDYKPINHKGVLKQEFNDLMEDSVKKRMISDVPLGAFLSGGLDSSTIVNFAKKFNKNINTYSIGFEGKYDETYYIDIVKNLFQTNHHHKYFEKKDFEDILKTIFYYYDEPFSDPSMFPTIFLSKFARQDLTVALSGDGGDEIFGGYPRYKIAKQLMFLRKIPTILRKILMIIPNEKIKEGVKISLLPPNEFYSAARENIYKPEITKKLLKEQLIKSLEKTNGNLVEAVRLMDIYFYTLSDNFLAKVDRASMASALEVRCPFLDYRLIEYSMTIPTKYKVSFRSDKKLFREITKNFLPDEIVYKKKQGFTPPINSWIEDENYEKELVLILDELSKNKILSNEWTDSYRNEILPKKSLVHNNYKIRLFLFYKWYKYWIKPD